MDLFWRYLISTFVEFTKLNFPFPSHRGALFGKRFGSLILIYVHIDFNLDRPNNRKKWKGTSHGKSKLKLSELNPISPCFPGLLKNNHEKSFAN